MLGSTMKTYFTLGIGVSLGVTAFSVLLRMIGLELAYRSARVLVVKASDCRLGMNARFAAMAASL